MDVEQNELLPTERVGEIKVNSSKAEWLIEEIWLAEAAGIIGGQPKCCKSWLGLDMAISVASGTDCLGRYPVRTTGPTLAYMAEDDPKEVRKRVEGICRHRSLDIAALDLTLITCPILKLDNENDRNRLRHTVGRIRPKLLLLDPLVRLHSLDENNSRDISQLLGFLRELQRTFNCAVLLTHHASKRAHSRPGQALRGSSDLHAFGDSNLYLSESNNVRELGIEHRSAASPQEKIHLRLTGDPVHLELTTADRTPKQASLEDRILSTLIEADQPLPRASLRQALRVNNQKFGQVLSKLIEDRAVIATPSGLRAP